jgi:hypothetical protein
MTGLGLTGAPPSSPAQVDPRSIQPAGATFGPCSSMSIPSRTSRCSRTRGIRLRSGRRSARSPPRRKSRSTTAGRRTHRTRTGFAGCMLALAAGPAAPADVHERAAAVTRRYAVEEDGLANWPGLADAGLRSGRDRRIRVQWCHGAPGMVASLAGLAPDDAEHERPLRAGGELAWRAVPLAKGANLCHGTAGNGYAFLALLERTGDGLARTRPRVRRACRRPGDAQARRVRPRALLAVDRRPGHGALSGRLPGRPRRTARAVGRLRAPRERRRDSSINSVQFQNPCIACCSPLEPYL